jgi:hypothetical protein
MNDDEKLLLAFAMYMVDPRPEEDVLKDMIKLIGSREEAERLASLAWRIVHGEGYTLDEWASLLESLKMLSPWECIWRFQELVKKGLRKKHPIPPLEIDDKEALRACTKYMGLG